MRRNKLSLAEGRHLVDIARAAIRGKMLAIKGFEKKQGVFVTLHSYPGKRLRGCIGFPLPTLPLGEAVEDAAKAAAFDDSRFNPIKEEEEFIVEISVLTEPELIKKDPLRSFTVGRHGLIIDHRGHYGLLLPQVFAEWKATQSQALAMVCEKAGLGMGAWEDKGCKIYKFEAQLFIEEKPEGNVVEECM